MATTKKQDRMLLELARSILLRNNPRSWIDFLLDLQTDLISYGHFELMSKEYIRDFTFRIVEIQRIFTELDEIKASVPKPGAKVNPKNH